MKLIVGLLLLLLPSIAVAQVTPPDTLTADRRASYIQGAIRGELTYGQRALLANVAGDTAAVGANIRAMLGQVRSTETHVLKLRVKLREYILIKDTAFIPLPVPGDTVIIPPPVDTIPPVVVVPPDTVIPPIVVVEPPETEQWPDSSRIRGDFVGDLVIPCKRVLIEQVTIAGNLRTECGVISMRPGSRLTFVGGVPANYVGGGMRFEDRFAQDIGLWVGGTGVLDFQGTPKEAWNRTGESSTWSAGDELWIMPTAVGDLRARRWNVGDSIPQIDPLVPPTEVVNVTRDIIIEGPGHIHISSSQPQRVEYVTLRRMGIANTALGTITGRYALHFHMMGEGSRGSVVRGVAAVNSGGEVFVPHTSHGIKFEDVVVLNGPAHGFWWDTHHLTHDTTVDRLLVAGVARAIQLWEGLGNRMTNSVAVGNSGSGTESHGFEWSSGQERKLPLQFEPWTFEGNLAHNNRGFGIRFWSNNGEAHQTLNYIGYRNQGNEGGFEQGAYRSNALHVNALLLEEANGGVYQHASAGAKGRIGNSYQGLQVIRPRSGPAVRVEGLTLPSAPLVAGQDQVRTEFVDCKLESAPGWPKVRIQGGNNPFFATFRRCGLLPTDVVFTTFPATLAGSSVIIEHEDGRRWEITLDIPGKKKVVRLARDRD